MKTGAKVSKALAWALALSLLLTMSAGTAWLCTRGILATVNSTLYNKEMNEYTVVLFWDSEAKVWVATSEDYPIVLESESFDELLERVRIATPELLEGNNLPADGMLHFKVDQTESLKAAV